MFLLCFLIITNVVIFFNCRNFMIISNIEKRIKSMFDNRVNVLKALAILLVVSGHLEFSLLGMFTPYSFQLALFFLFQDTYLRTSTLTMWQTLLKEGLKRCYSHTFCIVFSILESLLLLQNSPVNGGGCL